MKKIWFFPLMTGLLCVVMIFLFEFAFPNNIVFVLAGLVALLVYFFIVLPAESIIFARRIAGLKLGIIFLLSIYNAAVITVMYLLPLMFEDETYIYCAFLFAWVFLWAFLPAMFSKPQKNDPTIQKEQ